jgi:hypothetical protein
VPRGEAGSRPPRRPRRPGLAAGDTGQRRLVCKYVVSLRP